MTSMADWPWGKREELYRRALKHWGNGAQFLMSVEEMSELAQAILKLARQGVNPTQAIMDVLQEIADVEIMLEQLRIVFGDLAQVQRQRTETTPDIGVDSIKAKKLARLAERLDMEEQAR